jgi:2-hydroxycyclohexanecarboxyl-CoA dehydrogenase
MIAAGKGKIISIASDAGRVGGTRESVYAAAKAGLLGFAKSLARCAINVNCVCLGRIDGCCSRDPTRLRIIHAQPLSASPSHRRLPMLFSVRSARSDFITAQVLSAAVGSLSSGDQCAFAAS